MNTKRFFAILLALLTFLPLPVDALATDTPFTLRNGYYWGMPPEEFRALAADEPLTMTGSYESGPQAPLEYSSVPVGGYPALMWAHFQRQPDGTAGLWRVMYHFDSINQAYGDPANEIMFAALRQGLVRTYGAPVVDALGQVSEASKWILPDTKISLMKFNGGMNFYCAIEYVQDTASFPSATLPIPHDGF